MSKGKTKSTTKGTAKKAVPKTEQKSEQPAAAPAHTRDSPDGHRMLKEAEGRDEKGIYTLFSCKFCGKTERQYRTVPAR